MTLFPFQREGVDWLKAHKRAMLCDDTGLGKTLMYIQLARELELKRVLIICPAYLRLTIASEVTKWWPEALATVRTDTVENSVVYSPCYFDIVSYQFCLRDDRCKFLAEVPYGLVICDESQAIRNWKAVTTRNIVKIVLPKRDRIILATATPLVRAGTDLHPPFSVIDPGKWGKYGEFCRKYCRFDYYSQTYKGLKETEGRELWKETKRFMLRRKKEDVYRELPSVTICDQVVSLDRSYDAEIFDAEGNQTALSEETKGIYQELGLAKIPAVVALADTLSLSEQLVIFAWHRGVVDSIAARLSESGRHTATLMGGDSQELRQRVVSAFQAGKLNTIVANIGAAGAGLTFTASAICIFAELPWDHTTYYQAYSRLVRIGQKRPVTVYRLIGENSLDARIVKVAEMKKQAADILLEDAPPATEEPTIGEIGAENLVEMFLRGEL